LSPHYTHQPPEAGAASMPLLRAACAPPPPSRGRRPSHVGGDEKVADWSSVLCRRSHEHARRGGTASRLRGCLSSLLVMCPSIAIYYFAPFLGCDRNNYKMSKKYV
jgi:hypothetical protein